MKHGTVSRDEAPLVVPLEVLTPDHLGIGGGKGVGLGALIHAGFPVPTGFCVTTQAYRLVAERANLVGLFEESPDSLDRLAETARSALLAIPVPDDVAAQIAAAYHALGDGPVAVRSSATAEDLPNASFAGQQETYLNIIGVDALLDAVRRCWASLWTDRAVTYRAANGIDHEGVALAVVVQRMVDAAAAGVLFTANPISGARGELVIDASEGLGEAVVSGRVTPDRYVVAKRPLRIKERRLGKRETVIRARPGGGTEEVASRDEAQAPAVPARVVRALARLGIAIERRAGVPQDVEWAWAGGKLFVLQARPITALPEPVRASWINRQRARVIGELLPIRPYPLDLAFLSVLGRRLLEAMFGPLGVGVDPIDQAVVTDDGVVVRIGLWGPRPTVRMLALPWAMWRSRRVNVAGWEDDPLLHEAVRRVGELEARDLRTLDWAGVLGTAEEAMDSSMLIARLRGRYLVPAFRDLALFFLLLAFAGQHRYAPVLLSGVETKTLELNRALEALAEQVRAAPALRATFADARDAVALLRRLEESPEAAEFLVAFQALLVQYGHRETLLMPSQPTWKHAPEVPLGAIKALASSQPSPRTGGPPEWERARDRLLARSILGRAPLRGRFLRLLERARWVPQFREDTHFFLTLTLPVIRSCWLELGRRLVEAGVLDTPEDVFHLTLQELARAGTTWPPTADTLALRQRVTRRKARRAALGERLPTDPRLTARGLRPAGALLAGVPGSPGLAEGPVRIVASPSAFGTLQAGEVLVAPFTNPAWTPLFQRAVAVIVETGSAVSHAAIVAREYGIPAVMGAADATRLLADGQRVRVDGNAGAVFAA